MRFEYIRSVNLEIETQPKELCLRKERVNSQSLWQCKRVYLNTSQVMRRTGRYNQKQRTINCGYVAVTCSYRNNNNQHSTQPYSTMQYANKQYSRYKTTLTTLQYNSSSNYTAATKLTIELLLLQMKPDSKIYGLCVNCTVLRYCLSQLSRVEWDRKIKEVIKNN